MRIVCPNCNAGYEIPNRAISVEGREVQCSSCAHTWYQLPKPESAKSPGTSSDPFRPTAGDSGTAFDDEAQDTDAPAIPRRPIDPEVLEVLRQEASREARARQSESGSFPESQPELGLHPPKRAKKTMQTVGLRDRLARLQAAEKSAVAQTWLPGAKGPDEQPVEPTPPKPTNNVEEKDDHAESKPVASATSPDVQPAPFEKPSVSPARLENPEHNREKVVPGLPVALSSTELALIEEKKARKGFRLGFGVTAGACCLLVALYVGATLVPKDYPGGQLFETLRDYGETVQGKVIYTVQSAVTSATSQLTDQAE